MLEQSRADLVTAQANLSLAEITAKREDNLFSTQSVAAQERDNAAGAFAADKAIVESKEADVARLEQLQRYEKILAPFDGVITARNVNIGALVNAGAATPASELFHLAALDKLRVYIAVPETYVTAARPGVSATLSLDEYPNESFRGTLVRTSNAIDPVSRTLLCEVDVDNRDKRLLPGAYAFVHLEMKNETPALTVPSNTLLFRSEGLVAGVVRQGQVRLIPVKIGRDYGDRVEIISGLQPTDSIVLNPMDSITDGARVRLKDNEKVAKNR
jgi:RND family efflux transporter MFP subunit